MENTAIANGSVKGQSESEKARNNSQKQKAKKLVSLPDTLNKGIKTKTVNSAFGLVKSIVIFFGIIVLVVCTGAFYLTYNAYEATQNRVFIVTKQGTVVAEQTHDIKDRELELKNHVKLFLNSMYAFDENSYEANIDQGLELVGNDGKLIREKYNKMDMLGQLVKTNGKVTVAVDSIWTDMTKEPYRVRAFARQTFDTPTGRVQKYLWMDMAADNIARSPKNIGGFKLNNLVLVRDGDIPVR